MPSKQELRSEETKNAIVSAAGKLFSERGFDAVTMREIAKEAGCSHTTIYIYFKDKEMLLHQLSMPPLLDLKDRMERILNEDGLSPEEKVKGISHEFIRFCLLHRNMYTVFFVTKSARVDQEPKQELNKLRNSLFELLQRSIRECLEIQQNEARLLAFSRIFFFNIHGIVATYNQSEEAFDVLMERLAPTFDEAIEVLLLGFKQKMSAK